MAVLQEVIKIGGKRNQVRSPRHVLRIAFAVPMHAFKVKLVVPLLFELAQHAFAVQLTKQSWQGRHAQRRSSSSTMPWHAPSCNAQGLYSLHQRSFIGREDRPVRLC
jgi:hypothetical protein